MHQNITGLVVNNVDPDQMPHFVASDLGLHCLLRPVCQFTYGEYSKHNCILTAGHKTGHKKTMIMLIKYWLLGGVVGFKGN